MCQWGRASESSSAMVGIHLKYGGFCLCNLEGSGCITLLYLCKDCFDLGVLGLQHKEQPRDFILRNYGLKDPEALLYYEAQKCVSGVQLWDS